MIESSENLKKSCSFQYLDSHSQNDNNDIIQKFRASQYFDLYLQRMQKIQICHSNELSVDLKSSGFYIQSNYKNNYLLFKQSIKNDSESAFYSCNIKNIRISLTTLKLKLKSDSILRYFKVLGKGQFGQIFKFHAQMGYYAVKSIRVQQNNQKQIDKALTEIIITKIASILKAGPKFQTVFGYDAIIFTDSVIFAMQLCSEIEIQNQKDIQKLNQNLLSALKTLHSFKICHIDIKTDNIAWSNKFQRFVLIDFGFAKVLDQAPGQKTKSKYMGTFRYSSPQIKKLYFLKIADFVDLYYNDIHGIEVIISGFKQLLESSVYAKRAIQQSQDMVISQSKQIFIQYQQNTSLENVQEIIQYFKFRFSLFQENPAEIKRIISKKRSSMQTFHKLIVEQLQKKQDDKALNQQLRELRQIIQKQNDKQRYVSLLDSFFLDYTFRMSNEMISESSYQKLIQISISLNSKELLNKIWLDPHWMVEIFNFIDVYNVAQGNIAESRGVILQNIHSLIFETKSQISLTMKMRDVMLYFFSYFQQKASLTTMMRIHCYFVMFNDMFEQDRMQQIILKILRKDGSKQDFIKNNIQYFFGKLLLTDKMDFVEEGNNEQNLVEYLCQVKDDDKLSQMISDSIQLLRLAKSRYGLFWSKQTQGYQWEIFTERYLKKYEQKISSDIKKLINYYSHVQNTPHRESDFHILTKIKFDNNYLKCSFAKFILYTKVQHSEIEGVRQILKKQPFLRQFKAFVNIFGNQLDSNDSKTICKDTICILKNHNFQLQQNDLFTLALQLQDPREFLNFLSEYLNNMRIFDRKQNNIRLLISIYRILSSFFQFLQIKKCSSTLLKIVKNDQCSKIIQRIAEFQRTIKISLSHYQSDISQYEYYLQINQSLVLMIKEDSEHAAHLLMQLNQKYFQFIPISYLVRIYLSVNPAPLLKKNMQSHFLDYFEKLFKKNRFEFVFYCPDFFIAIVRNLIFIKGEKQTFEILKTFYKYIQDQKRFDMYPYAFPLFRKFSQAISEKEKIMMLRRVSYENKLEDFNDCYIILIIALKVLIYLPTQALTKEIRVRILKMCVFFVFKFQRGLFRPFKNLLNLQSAKLFDKKRCSYANSQFRPKGAILVKLKKIKFQSKNVKKTSKLQAVNKILKKAISILKSIENTERKEL